MCDFHGVRRMADKLAPAKSGVCVACILCPCNMSIKQGGAWGMCACLPAQLPVLDVVSQAHAVRTMVTGCLMHPSLQCISPAHDLYLSAQCCQPTHTGSKESTRPSCSCAWCRCGGGPFLQGSRGQGWQWTVCSSKYRLCGVHHRMVLCSTVQCTTTQSQ